VVTCKVATRDGADFTVQADFAEVGPLAVEFWAGTQQHPASLMAIVPLANLLSIERIG
jgi:hypothetical protein